jgi:hypothetical protein
MCRLTVAMCAMALAACALPGNAVAESAGLTLPRTLELQAALSSSGSTVAEAKESLALQHQASRVDLVGQLEEELGQSYASLWFDNANGEFVVPVATADSGRAATQAIEGAVEQELSSAALGSDYRTEVVRYSSEELEAGQKKLDEELAPLFEEGVVQTAIDPEDNAVEVLVASGASAASLAEVETSVADAGVEVKLARSAAESFGASSDACIGSPRTCDLPVRGGEEMWSEEEFVSEGTLVSAICTTGFRANGYDGRKYILTAGHCAKKYEIPGGETLWGWFTSDTTAHRHSIGSIAQWHYPGKDWAKIDATGTWADTPPWPTEVAYWGSTDEYPVVGEARAYVGETVCHVGAATGASCGTVVKENATPLYDEGSPSEAQMNSMFKVEGSGLLAGKGDSGGPVIAGNIAVGIDSGARWENLPHETVVYFSDVTEATAELNVNIAGPGITEVITGGASGVGTGSATVSGQVDPHGVATEFLVEYGQSSYDHFSNYSSVGAGQGFVPVSQTLTGLEPATTYKYRLSAVNGFGEAHGSEGTFTTAPVPPVVTIEPAEFVKKDSATLGGTVNPRGSATSYQVEYGTTTGYGSVAPVGPEAIGSGRTAVKVRQVVTGLGAGTTYHFRVKAFNAAGTSYSSDATFTTPSKPVIASQEANFVNTLEPRLKAMINPERATTTYQFEYGTTASYGTKVPVPAGEVGRGSVAEMATQWLKGLARNTTYHYRVVAENEVGVVKGADRTFNTLPACKGAEAKCLWSLQTASNPAPANQFELKSVSCYSATFCMAVGKNTYNGRAFVDRWNGSSWSLLSGTVVGEMKHLSCVATGCVTVGTSGGVAATWWVGEISGTQGVFPIAAAIPAGATETNLVGVSCLAQSSCTAVGSYRASGGAYHSLVERWNGSGWSLQSAPDPAEGTAQNAMLSVSCIPLGCITVGEAAGKPVAATWINGSWALSGPQLPAGAKGGKLTSVSCTEISCIAVGESHESVGTEKALAESYFYPSWTLQSVPAPAGSKGFAELSAVSCPSSSACTATGHYASSISGGVPLELKTLAESWNGSAWTAQASPNAPGQAYNALADVSCSSAAACTAVGADSAGIGQRPESLAERWNGTTWSTQAVVNPELPIETELKSVSCSSNTQCVGAGKDLFGEGGFVEVWNGATWSVAATFPGEMRKISCTAEGCLGVGVKGGMAEAWVAFQVSGAWAVTAAKPPTPAGATESSFSGVSCWAGSACTAVGSYRESSGAYHPLVERWDGSTWTRQAPPDPAEGSAQNAMLAVSCARATFCAAVGEAAGKPVAEVWSGGAWTRSPTISMPAGAKGATLVGVSCGSTEGCMAVGDSYEGAGSEKPLAVRWDGVYWQPASAPAPAGAKGFANLTDVSCLSHRACIVGGYYAPEVSAGTPASLKTVAESWDGSTWTVLTTPNLAGQTYNSLAGISCTTSINCTAVGGAASNLSKRPPVQVAMRFE